MKLLTDTGLSRVASRIKNDRTLLDMPKGEILWLSPKGCTTASIAEEGGVIDLSGCGNHGQYVNDQGDLVSITSDEHGIGYNFIGHESGRHKIRIPSSFLANTKDLSIYTRLKMTGQFQDQDLTIFSVGYTSGSSTYNQRQGCYFNVSDLKFNISVKPNNEVTGQRGYSQNNAYTLNTPANVIIIYKYIDAYTIKVQMYLDSNVIIDETLTFEMAYRNDSIKPYFYLGSFYTGENDFNSFRGMIYDYRIYPYALTPTQVKTLYMASTQPIARYEANMIKDYDKSATKINSMATSIFS